MSLIDGIIYGIVQGLTEFFPVSSSAHLALLPKVMHFRDPGVTFDLFIHLGTALAVLIYYFKDLLKMFFSLIKMLRGKPDTSPDEMSFSLVKNYLLATAVSMIVILVIKDSAAVIGRQSEMIALNLVVFGFLLFICDLFRNRSETNLMSQKNYGRAIVIGLAQAIAIFPGVSRSGITITAGCLFGMNKKEASKFSFLLSLPVILGGALIKIPDFLKQPELPSWETSLWGIGISFIVGILSIHFFLKWMTKLGFWPFCLYRMALGILILYYL
jgi:undecaprenyl-diphosphatase